MTENDKTRRRAGGSSDSFVVCCYSPSRLRTVHELSPSVVFVCDVLSLSLALFFGSLPSAAGPINPRAKRDQLGGVGGAGGLVEVLGGMGGDDFA